MSQNTIPSYRIIFLRKRYNPNLLIPTKLSLEEKIQAIKKLNLIQQYSKNLGELREDEIIEKNCTLCKHCDRNLLLP